MVINQEKEKRKKGKNLPKYDQMRESCMYGIDWVETGAKDKRFKTSHVWSSDVGRAVHWNLLQDEY